MLQFLNNAVGDKFNMYFWVCGVAIKILFIANDCDQFLDVAIAFTINGPYSLNIWVTLSQLFVDCLFPSQKSRSIFSIFQLDSGVSFTLVGNHVLIASTLIKKLNPFPQSHNGVSSKSLFHNEITTWLLSSTIQTGFLIQSPSMSSSHTFQIQSSSKSYWFWLNK